MAETQTEDSTIVLDIESRITNLETLFQESIGKMMKLMQKGKEESACDGFDKVLAIVNGLFRNQENIRKWLEESKAEFENFQKKEQEKILEAIEGFRKQEADLHKSLDGLKNALDSNGDDDSSNLFEIDISSEEAERELYKSLYGKDKDDQIVDEGSSSRNEASLYKDSKIDVPSSSSDSGDNAQWYKSYHKSDMLKQNSEREAVIERQQDFKNLEERSKTRTNLRKNVHHHH